MPVHPQIVGHSFLAEMDQDSYYPPHLVDMGKAILVRMCDRIEAEKPANLDELYAITHAATEEFIDLEEAFNEADSEIETVSRDAIGTDFYFIAAAYGFADADIEELIAPREW